MSSTLGLYLMTELSKHFAFDKSAREYTVDGHLFVSGNPITKATVNPYFGSEIPDAEALGLDPGRVYNLLRDPEELRKAAPSFAGLPVLIRHKPSTSDAHPTELTVGSTGTDPAFDGEYVRVTLSVWDGAAIAGIHTKQQTEISSGYRYRADMTPGEWQGQPYDGVMRDIVGNHVALVDVGRAGPDVVVNDVKPHSLRGPKMAKPKITARGRVINTALRVALTPKLAADHAMPSLVDIVKGVRAKLAADERLKLVKDVQALLKGKLAQDVKDEDVERIVKDAEEEDLASDEDDEEDEEERKKKQAADEVGDPGPDNSNGPTGKKTPAMDEATVQKLIDAKAAQVRADVDALYMAREEVAPICGKVALDSAEDVYAFALKQLGIDTTGVHPSAFRHMVKLAGDRKPQAQRIAQDAASADATAATLALTRRFGRA